MKHFLYIDTDIINSIIAQSEKGLVANITAESQRKNESSDVNSLENSTDGSAGINLLSLIKTRVDVERKGVDENSHKTSESTKEIMTKTLHDASFDMAYSIINVTTIDERNEALSEGEYIELVRKFDFIDFDYLISLFDEKGIIDFLKKSESKNVNDSIKTITEGFNRKQRRNIQKAGNEITKLKDNNNQYDNTYRVINALKNIIPCEKMLITSDGVLIPTENKFFRINPKNMGFMYGGEIHCVGMVTNIVEKDKVEESNNDNVFVVLKKTINETLRVMLATEEERLKVVHPIAIYYESESKSL